MSEIAINPQINVGVQEIQPLRIDGTNTSYQAFAANTGTGASQMNFTINFPSTSTILSRAVLRMIPLQLNFTGTNNQTGASSNLFTQDGLDALRSMVGLRIISQESIQLDGVTITQPTPNDTYPEIMCHYNKSYRQFDPLCVPDSTQNYIDGAGSINNPLAGYPACLSLPDGDQMKRGAFPLYSSAVQTATTAVLQYMIPSWLYYPALFGADQANKPGIVNVNTMQIQSTLNLAIQNIWSHAITTTGSGTTLTGFAASFFGTPQCYCKFITPPVDYTPKECVYPMLKFDPQPYIASGAPLAFGAAQVTIQSTNISTPTIPNYLFLYVKENNATANASSVSVASELTNCFCSITNVQINFNNHPNILSNTPQVNLWTASRDSGLCDSYQSFVGVTKAATSSQTAAWGTVGLCGSVICLQFGKEIELMAGHHVGDEGPFQLSVQVSFINPNPTLSYTNPTLYTIPCYEQRLVLSMTDKHIDFITEKYRGTGEAKTVPYDSGIEQFGGGCAGGSFFGSINNFLKKTGVIHHLAKSFSPEVASVAKSLGYGGAKMSTAQLSKMMSRL